MNVRNFFYNKHILLVIRQRMSNTFLVVVFFIQRLYGVVFYSLYKTHLYSLFVLGFVFFLFVSKISISTNWCQNPAKCQRDFVCVHINIYSIEISKTKLIPIVTVFLFSLSIANIYIGGERITNFDFLYFTFFVMYSLHEFREKKIDFFS